VWAAARAVRWVPKARFALYEKCRRISITKSSTMSIIHGYKIHLLVRTGTHRWLVRLTWAVALTDLSFLYRLHLHPNFEKIFERQIYQLFLPSIFLPPPGLQLQIRLPPARNRALYSQESRVSLITLQHKPQHTSLEALKMEHSMLKEEIK